MVNRIGFGVGEIRYSELDMEVVMIRQKIGMALAAGMLLGGSALPIQAQIRTEPASSNLEGNRLKPTRADTSPSGFLLGELVVESVSNSRVVVVVDQEVSDGWADLVVAWESSEPLADPISIRGTGLVQLAAEALIVRFFDSRENLIFTVGSEGADEPIVAEIGHTRVLSHGLSLKTMNPSPSRLSVDAALYGEQPTCNDSLSFRSNHARTKPVIDDDPPGGCWNSCWISCNLNFACNADCGSGCAVCECSGCYCIPSS